MNSYIEKVKEFHDNFDHPVNSYKEQIPLSIRQLRIKLIFEELQELAEASDVKGTFVKLCQDSISKEVNGNEVNKKEEVDALCDLQYVLSGAVLALGHQENFDEAFSEVHDSNMSKMCNSLDEVQDTIKHYREKGVESFSVPKGDKWMVLRSGDNKVLKNVYYKEAQLEQFVK